MIAEEQMTVSAYARYLDLSHTAVQKAVSTGKIVAGWDSHRKRIKVKDADDEWGNGARINRPKAGVSKVKVAEKLQKQQQVAENTKSKVQVADRLQNSPATVTANFLIAPDEPFSIPSERIGHISPQQLQVLTDFTGAVCLFYEIDFEELLLPDDDELELIVRQQVLSYMLIEGAKMSGGDVAEVFDWNERTITGYVSAISKSRSLQKSLSYHFAGALRELSAYHFTYQITIDHE